jgi:signal transduction histidine kinase
MGGEPAIFSGSLPKPRAIQQSNPQPGKVMNDQIEFPQRIAASSEHANGHAPDTEPPGGMDNAGSTGAFPRHFDDLAGRRRTKQPWRQHHPMAGTGNRHNKEFLTVFSHEIRNSLSAIRSASGILGLEKSAGPAALKARLLIERQVGQMTRLVDDLLDLSRIRNGQLRLRRERIDLCAAVAQSAQTVEFTMQQHKHRMTTSFPDAPVWLQADPARLEQVFVNLLLNAAKYTEAGGKVGLFVEREEREAIVRIRDSGIGISPDVLPHVFDLFVQADPSSRRADAGLGIGLALVRSLVERHGGRVTVVSAGLGHGSEFTVRLPRPVD